MSLIYRRKLRQFFLPWPMFRIKSRLDSTMVPTKLDSATKTEEKLVNRWLAFWKQLFNDYKSSLVEITKNMKDNPVKTLIWSSLISFSAACSITNPDEIHYRDNFIRRLNELIFVSKTIRNPECMNYLETIEWFFNCDEIRRIDLGLFSIMLHEPKRKHSALYKDNCPYLQPSFAEILDSHLLDIGFWNRWWMLEKSVIDYDINPEEWK